MTEYDDHLDAENAAMRDRSGHVRDARPLTAFLYLLVRDHVVPGAIEEMLLEISARPEGADVEFTNGWMARYAQDVAARLEADPTLAATALPSAPIAPDAGEEPADGEWWVDLDAPLAMVRLADRPDVPKLMCRQCKAANPDLRRTLLEEHGRVQACWYCRGSLPDLPPDAPTDMMAPADPSKGEEICGHTDRTGRLVCTLPDGHREHGDPIAEADAFVKMACGAPMPAHLLGEDDADDAVCGKPKGHERHGAEGVL